VLGFGRRQLAEAVTDHRAPAGVVHRWQLSPAAVLGLV
jgi:hypothetical protein